MGKEPGKAAEVEPVDCGVYDARRESGEPAAELSLRARGDDMLSDDGYGNKVDKTYSSVGEFQLLLLLSTAEALLL